MKQKYLILSFTIAILVSCKNDEIEYLEKKIISLEASNKKLADSSLSKFKFDELTSSEMILIPQAYTFNPGGTNSVSGIFRQRNSFPKFDLYYADDQDKPKYSDKIEYQLKPDNGFEFNIDKQKAKIKELKVIAVFDSDTTKIQLFGVTGLP